MIKKIEIEIEPMTIQSTSLEAYSKVKFSNFCNYQKAMTLKMLEKEELCGTDMAKCLKVARYAYRPRLTELQKEGKIMDSGERKSFHYIDRNQKSQISREIIWRKTPKSFQSGFLF